MKEITSKPLWSCSVPLATRPSKRLPTPDLSPLSSILTFHHLLHISARGLRDTSFWFCLCTCSPAKPLHLDGHPQPAVQVEIVSVWFLSLSLPYPVLHHPQTSAAHSPHGPEAPYWLCLLEAPSPTSSSGSGPLRTVSLYTDGNINWNTLGQQTGNMFHKYFNPNIA